MIFFSYLYCLFLHKYFFFFSFFFKSFIFTKEENSKIISSENPGNNICISVENISGIKNFISKSNYLSSPRVIKETVNAWQMPIMERVSDRVIQNDR